MTQEVVLLDLDGTLVESAPGILMSVQHALGALGLPVPEAGALHWVIGPPLRRSFLTLTGGDGALAEQALALYRERYDAGGLFEGAVYDGIFPALEALRASGQRLMLCTAKPRPFAERVVGHFGLAPLMEGIYGSELDGRFDDKGELIAHILQVEGIGAAGMVMVGDRANDTGAAARNGMASVGVTWGYGDAAELLEGGAGVLCHAPADLPGAVAAVRRG